MKKIIIVLLSVTFCLLLLNWFNPILWQDIKLKTTPYWSFGTLSSNPFLPTTDADLSETDYQDKQITPRIDPNNLFSGGPPKDGIPSIDDPAFEPISNTDFDENELIIGLEINGDVRAYPYSILNWHEVVNDTVGGTPVAITYCPLCETNSVFVRELDGTNVEFGVSGKLYESCLVMYDRTTDTLYSQPWGTGIIGEKTNHVLKRVPAIRTTVGSWREKYPNSLILSTKTGHNRNYTRYPYGSYYTNEEIIFPVSRQGNRKDKAKEITQIVFQHNGQNSKNRFSGVQYAFTQKQVRKDGLVEFQWNNEAAMARWDKNLQTIIFTDQSGTIIPDMALFNFVYPAHFQ